MDVSYRVQFLKLAWYPMKVLFISNAKTDFFYLTFLQGHFRKTAK